MYGKIEKTINCDGDKRIEVKTANMNGGYSYRIYKISDGRLYTDRVRDTAVILENKIIEGPSFQLRDNSNAPASNNIVFEKGTPRRLRNLNGIVASLLTGGGGNNNYWHWIYDVLPRLKLCDQIKKLEQIDFFILPSLKRSFQNETLKELNLGKKKLLSSEVFRHIKAKELIVTDHPYIVTNDFHKDSQNIPEWIIKWLREKFLKDSKRINKNYPKSIFLHRSDSKPNTPGYRSLVNEAEIKEFLMRKNFTMIRLNELSFLEQVQYFNNAECIIGLHGAGFANLTFCRHGTKVIEFRTASMGKIIGNLAMKNDLKFDSIVSNPVSTVYGKQSGDIKIPLDILEQKINDI